MTVRIEVYLISLVQVLLKDQFRVAYDSENGGVFDIHIPGKNSMYFPCYNNGLHIHECGTNGFSFVETVASNKQGYFKMLIQYAERVGKLIKAIGNPSENDFKTLIRMNPISNCPVAIQDVETYFKIYKRNVLALKGNTIRTKPKVYTIDLIKYQSGSWIKTRLLVVY